MREYLSIAEVLLISCWMLLRRSQQSSLHKQLSKLQNGNVSVLNVAERLACVTVSSNLQKMLHG